MNDVRAFLRSLRADLIERRLWPLLVVAAAGLVAAVVLIGNGSSATTTPPPTMPAGGLSVADEGPALSPVPPNSNAAIAETANGSLFQRQGGAHDPFTLQPATVCGCTTASKTSASSPASGSSASGSSSSGSSGSSGGSSVPTPTPSTPTPSSPTPSAPSTPPSSKPKKATTVDADFRFGLVPASASATGATGPSGTTDLTVSPSNLQEYSTPKLNTPLPDADSQILSLVGATSGGTELRFAVQQELFINGPGTCVPSPTNCQDIDLAPGDIETFQYDSPTLGLVTYELAVVAVNGNTSASTASVRHGTRLPATAIVHAGPIHGQAVPVPLISDQVSALMLSRGVLAPAPQFVGAGG